MIKTAFALFAVFAFLWIPQGRSAEPTTVAGKWHFVLDTEGGDRDADSILEQNGEKITGKWNLRDSKTGGDTVAGTFVEKQLALEFPTTSEEAGPGTLTLKGQLADDGTIAGKWTFQDYSGTFKASRAKEDAK